MFSLRRSVFALVAAAAALVAVAGPASAHGTLVRSTPADASVLDVAPDRLDLTFSEPVSVESSSIEFVDSDGTRHEASIVGHGETDSVIVVEFGDVPDGLYSLRWSAFSTSDGHITKGLLVWGIGTGADLSAAEFAAPDEPVPPVEIFTRWALYIGIAAVLGGLVVGAGVLTDLRSRFMGAADAPWHEIADQRTRSIVLFGARTAALAATMLVVEQLFKASSASGQGLVSTIETSLLATTWGRWALLRAIALAVLAFVLHRAGSCRGTMRLPLILIGSAVVAQAAGSHAAGADAALLAILNDAVHLATSLAWGGALFVLWRILRGSNPADPRSPIVRAALSAFSPVAAVLFTMALITGVLAIGGQVQSVDALIGSLYGRGMIAKLVLVAVVAGLAITARRSIASDTPGAPIAAESVAAMAVVAVAALLTAVSPANGAEWLPAIDADSRQLAIVQDDVQLAITVSPNVPGQNLVLVDAISTRRPDPAPIDRVLVRISPVDFEASTTVVEALPAGSRGEYEVPSTAFSVAGLYEVELVVRRAGLLDVVGSFEWSVGSPANTRDVVVSDAELEPTTSLLGVSGAVVVILVMAWAMLNASVRERRVRGVEEFLLEAEKRPEMEL